MQIESRETARAIERLKAILACCEELDGNADIAADLAEIRETVAVVLDDFETEYLTASNDEFVLITELNRRLLQLDARCRDY
jgi:hypothetical protein